MHFSSIGVGNGTGQTKSQIGIDFSQTGRDRDLISGLYYIEFHWNKVDYPWNSLTASVINLFFHHKQEERVYGLRYLNIAIGLLVIYGVLALNPFALYKTFVKRKRRRSRDSTQKKKRVRVLNYEPIPSMSEYSKHKQETSSQ